MRQLCIHSVIALITVLTLAHAEAVQPTIGVASAHGAFRVDEARVIGNATLFDGAVLETDKATSDVRLGTGAQMVLGTSSRCKVFREHMVIEKGMSQVANLGQYEIQAGKLRIVPSSLNSKGVVTVKNDNLVEVAALTGGFRVTTDHGVLLAKLLPNQPLAFDTQMAGATAATKLNGVITKENGHYVITDHETGLKYEVVGEGVAKAVGKNVSLTGVVDASQNSGAGATEVLRVTSLTVHQAAGAAAATTGAVIGTKTIIAGTVIAAAGTGIGLGVAKANEGSSSASR